MGTRRRKNESFETLKSLTDNQKIDVVAQVDATTAAAVKESAENEKHMEDVQQELEKAAQPVHPKKPEEPETAPQNDFTAKLVLEESIADFKLYEDKKTDGRASKVYEDDDEDEYLDYDMFDFIYGLVTDCWPKPINPLGHKMRKFMYIGSDKYIDSDATEVGNVTDGHAQVASTGDSIEVYANTPEEFNDIEEICKMYGFTYSGPTPKRSKSTYWNYSFKIDVPCVGSGYPYMVEEYFETIGKTLEDVMPADFCKQYRKRQAKIEKEAKTYLNQSDVDKFVEKAIVAAAQDNTEPLEAHVKRLFADLDAAGLAYKKAAVKKTFMDAFDDED